MEKLTITEPFLKRLQAAIDADKSINVSALSTKAGLSNSTIRHMIDKNRSPRVGTMRKICAALGTTLEAFMLEGLSEEELEIIRLVSQLPVHLRRQLLGYGQGLVAAQDQPLALPPKDEV